MTLKKSDYINYRFKRSEESFEEALIMIENKNGMLLLAGSITHVIMLLLLYF